MNSYLFSVDYPLNEPLTNIGFVQVNRGELRALSMIDDVRLQIVSDDRCQVQYFLRGQSTSLFAVSPTGNLSWSNASINPTREAYQFQVLVQQVCLSLIRNISTDVIVTIRNFPSTTSSSAITSGRSDSSTTYAIIATVGGVILVIVATLFIVIYYNIQRAKHRVPPFFKIRQNSSAQGLSFFKSKSPINESSPYTLGVRDDDSSHGSEQTASSPVNNRLLSGHYKVSEPPVNTTIEELLSTYDNRSTSSSSSSSTGGCEPNIATNPGSFRTTVRESTDHATLDTINEDAQWMNNHLQGGGTAARRLPTLRHPMLNEDAMDIISESHEVEERLRRSTNACLACSTHSNPLLSHLCSHCYALNPSTFTHLLFSSSSSSSSSGSTTTVGACRQQTTTATTFEVGANSFSYSNASFDSTAATRC